MKLVYITVTPFFPSPTRWDGAYCFDFVKTLEREIGAKICVFVPGTGEDYVIDDVNVYRFPTRHLPSSILPFLFRRYNEQSFLNKAQSVLSQTLHFTSYPNSALLASSSSLSIICHAHTVSCAIYALAAKRMLGAKAILHHHDLASFGLNTGVLRHCWLNNMLHYPLLRKLIEDMDVHIFCSEASRRSLLSVPDASWTCFKDYRCQFRGLSFFRSPRIKRSLILHNGVDTNLFRHGEEVNRGDAFIIGCVGNFQELKDQLTLLESFRLLRLRGYTNMRLRLLGGDSTLGRLQRLKGKRSYLSRCRQFVRDNQLENCVEFLPEMRHEALPDFYRSLQLFVLPSYFEGFGCVYTEAWCCGVPFIACKGQGIADILDESEQSKWLCNPRDPEDLARLIERYYKFRDKQNIKAELGIRPLAKKFLEELC